jgi:hypothetical protein
MTTRSTNARAELARSFKAAILDTIEWRRASDNPKDGTVTIVCGAGSRSAAGTFKNGAWTNGKGKPLPFPVSHWMAFTDG